MKIKEIFSLMLEKGVENGPKPKNEIEADLTNLQKEYEKMSENERLAFDKNQLINPFADTRLLFGNEEEEVESILVGIDMEVQELLLAMELNRIREKKIGLVLAHHPEGVALKGLSDVMEIQNHLMSDYGVPINVMEKLMAPHVKKIAHSLAPGNFERPVDAAKLLNMPFGCCHTAADNMVYSYLKNIFEAEDYKPKNLGEIIDRLMQEEEYKQGAKVGAAPYIAVGDKNSRPGKIAVSGITGGTDGPDSIYEYLARAGVGTVLEMHITEKNQKAAEKHHINVVVASHIPSDSLGMNLILDEVENRGIEIIATSGFIRVKRS